VDAAGRIVDRPWIETFTADGSAGIMDMIAFAHPALVAFAGLRARAVLPEKVR
jgi:hypothetical protein